VPSEAEGVASESIGFNDFCPSLQVVVVDAADEIGLREIQLIVAAIDEDAVGIEQRPHRAVAKSGGLPDSCKKVTWHIDSEHKVSEQSEYRMIRVSCMVTWVLATWQSPGALRGSAIIRYFALKSSVFLQLGA